MYPHFPKYESNPFHPSKWICRSLRSKGTHWKWEGVQAPSQREDVSTPTGSNALRIPTRSLHNGKELALRAPVCRPPTCWFADGSPLGLLEGELQSGVQRLEAILQRVLLVEFHQLLEREQQDRCSSRGQPTREGGRAGRNHTPLLLRSLATDSLKAPHDRELTPFPAARTILWGRNHIVSRQFS